MRVLSRMAAALLAAVALSAHAVPVMEMKAEDLIPMAGEFRKSLKLTPNQQILWQQIEGKTRTLLRERQARRERLQAATQQGLEASNVELRDLVGALEAETAASAAEENQLRAWWLELNDALSDPQRKQAAQFLTEQLLRVPDKGPGGGEGRPREDGEHSRGGHRRGMGGGMGGGPGGAQPGG